MNRKNASVEQMLIGRDVEARETFPAFENCTGKTCYDVMNNGYFDVTVKFPWRHARHIYGCSRNYEAIDPSKQPMRFRQFYLQYDKYIYLLLFL